MNNSGKQSLPPMTSGVFFVASKNFFWTYLKASGLRLKLIALKMAKLINNMHISSFLFSLKITFLSIFGHFDQKFLSDAKFYRLVFKTRPKTDFQGLKRMS